MKLIQRNRDAAYLQYDKYVDFDNPMVMEKAMDLTKNCRSVYEKIETIYYFVRDEIDHTWDAKDSTITICIRCSGKENRYQLFKGKSVSRTDACKWYLHWILLPEDQTIHI